MKKDIFNGKISTECRGLVKVLLIIVPIVLIVWGIGFLLVAIFYNNIQHGVDILLYILFAISLVGGISYPLITLHLIKIYPKHRKITKHFLREDFFREYDYSNEKQYYND